MSFVEASFDATDALDAADADEEGAGATDDAMRDDDDARTGEGLALDATFATDATELILEADEAIDDDELDTDAAIAGTQTPEQSRPPFSGSQSSVRSSVQTNPSLHAIPPIPPHISGALCDAALLTADPSTTISWTRRSVPLSP